jgi:hypothetical protein
MIVFDFIKRYKVFYKEVHNSEDELYFYIKNYKAQFHSFNGKPAYVVYRFAKGKKTWKHHYKNGIFTHSEK